MERHDLGTGKSGEGMLSHVGDTEGKAKAWVGLERATTGQDGKG